MRVVVAPFLGAFRMMIRPLAQIIDQDIARALQRIAVHETAEYVMANMRTIDSVSSASEVLSIALRNVRVAGHYLEFGVYRGSSINQIASRVSQDVYGFDSFEGLPERWRDGFDRGHFKVGRLPRVLGNVRLVKGWFEDTLPAFLRDHDGPVAFLHVDCDLYASTKTIFDSLEERIVPGTVIVFDEYFNYPGWRHGEKKAFEEFIQKTGLRYQYLVYNRTHEQVAVRIG
jgi:predicted O-methyltransferase YrrM